MTGRKAWKQGSLGYVPRVESSLFNLILLWGMWKVGECQSGKEKCDLIMKGQEGQAETSPSGLVNDGNCYSFLIHAIEVF